MVKIGYILPREKAIVQLNPSENSRQYKRLQNPGNMSLKAFFLRVLSKVQ